MLGLRSRPSVMRRPSPAQTGSTTIAERPWGRRKEWCAIATRYEKTAASVMRGLCLAEALDWLKR